VKVGEGKPLDERERCLVVTLTLSGEPGNDIGTEREDVAPTRHTTHRIGIAARVVPVPTHAA
jgi:hypothetical protein